MKKDSYKTPSGEEHPGLVVFNEENQWHSKGWGLVFGASIGLAFF